MDKVITLNDAPVLLKTKSTEEITFPLTDDVKVIIASLELYSAINAGRGMAAIQLGHQKRLFVMEKPAGSGRFVTIINPSIISISSKKRQRPEACFSVPLSDGIGVVVERPASVKARYQDSAGTTIIEELTGNNAQTFLHEYSHLEGFTMLDSSKYGKFIEFVRV